MKKQRFLGFSLGVFLSGCMVGPNYTPPEIQVSKDWGVPEEQIGEVKLNWWEEFHDPLLTEYIQKAALCNYDVLAAEARILRARAIRQISASSLFPQVNADINATKTYFSKNGPVFAIGPASGNSGDTTSPVTGLPFAVQIPQIQNLFNALFDATWELDLFGKTRRTVEVADALIGSAIEERNDVLISLFAEIARNYFELRGNQKRKELLEETLGILDEKASIVEIQWEAGYANRMDVESVEEEFLQAQAQIPDIIAEIYRNIYTLSILTGQMPEDLVEPLLKPSEFPTPPDAIAVGLRSDLLRRRPDVRKAERDLAAATASIGVAVASFFPTISLVAMGGLQSLNLPSLFRWDSRTWAYGGDANVPVFQGGKLVGTLHLTQAEQKSLAFTYQQTVLNAIQDAESSLIAYKQGKERSKFYRDFVEKAFSIYEISEIRWKTGFKSRIDLLDRQREWVESQLTLLNSDTQLLLSVAALYKSLGGGWEIEVSDLEKNDCEN